MTTEARQITAITPELERKLKAEFYDNLPYEEQGSHYVRPRFARDGEINTRSAGGSLGLVSFDTALPMQWYEEVHAKTGFWPQMLGFVWCYDVNRIFGEPVPVTYTALVLLRWYESLA